MNYLKTIIPTLLIATMFPQADAVGQSKKNVSSDQAMSDRPAENYLNTAIKEISGKKYKVVLIGDLRPELSIDGIPLTVQDLPMYQNLIGELSDTIWKRQREDMEKRNVITEKTKQNILNDLAARGYFDNRETIASFYLTSHQFLINGKKQEENVFTYFRNKYIKSADLAYYYEKPH